MYRDIPERYRELIEPIVTDHGLELVDVELRQGRAPWTVRVVVDTSQADGKVPVDSCAAISREIGVGIDVAELVPHAYQLEVSSPGLDRTLAREKDFHAACGQQVKIETHQPVEGRRRFKGKLLAFDGRVIEVEVDGEPREVPFEAVARARTLYQFTKDDFAAGAKGAKRAS